MSLLGVIVNTVAIVGGAILGQLLRGFSDEIKETIMKAIAIAVLALGIELALTPGRNFLVVMSSLVLGAIIGEWLRLEKRLNDLGGWLENRLGNKAQYGQIAKAFVTTTLLYCAGAMAVIGSLNSALRLDHQVLFSKAFLDGFSAIIFSSTLGIGVLFSAIPVFFYQGGIVLVADFIQQWLSEAMIEQIITDLSGTGGVLIMAIGFNILGLTNVKIGNLLPALLFTMVITYSLSLF